MVQVVFVHGVATRSSPSYDNEERNRNKLLRATIFGAGAAITNPRWGDLIPPLAFSGASFERDGVRALALIGGIAAIGETADPTGTSVLPQIAATSPAAAIDLLFAERIAMVEADDLPLDDADVHAFAAAVDLLDPAAPGDPMMLALHGSDANFVRSLRQLSNPAAALGIGDSLLDAARGIADRVSNFVSRGAYDLIVDPLNPFVALFLGDVFAYLKQGALRQAIREKICQHLSAAWIARTPGEPLVLIGHSLGGVILYDMLSEAGAAGLPDGFRADALVTVGSQPGLFQELGLFDHTPAPMANEAIAGPEAVGVWINTFDPIDPFGFSAAPMFKLAADYSFDSVAGLLSAHTTYFKRPQFHALLRRRLADVDVLP